MRSWLLFLGAVGVALGGDLTRVSVSMPYAHPAGVTYTPTALQYFHQPLAYAPALTHHTPTPTFYSHPPHIAKKTYEVRRPALHSQFYDVEQRVRIKPAGSTLLELEEPISKKEKSVTYLSPIHFYAPHQHHQQAFFLPVDQLHFAPQYVPAHPQEQLQPSLPPFQPPAFQPSPPSPAAPPSNPPLPPPQQPINEQPNFPSFDQFQDSESISIDNPDLTRSNQPSQPPREPMPAKEEQAQVRTNLRPEQPHVADLRSILAQFRMPQPSTPEEKKDEERPSPDSRSLPSMGEESKGLSPEVRVAGKSGEERRSDQERLLELLTGQGLLGRASEGGRVRARLLSVDGKESVSTRRIVVNRPVHTIEEVEVAEHLPTQSPIFLSTPHYS